MNGFFKKNRLIIASVPIILCIIYIYWMYAKLANSPQKPLSQKLPSVERGSVVDRNGKPLAVQTNFYHFGVTPKLIKNREFFAQTVSPILDLDVEETLARITLNKDASFMYIKKKITQNEYDELEKVVESNSFSHFCRFDRIPGRVYPFHSLASQLIGYMGDDGKGLSGIEYSQQDILSPEVSDFSLDTVYGKNIFLTIDANLQYKLEKIAKDAMASTQAESMMLIAADSRNGEILSYISLPETDLNHYPEASKEEMLDRPARNDYEPGSVFKIFTTASYIDTGAITPDTLFLCDGEYTKTTNLGEKIRITCLDHHGWVTAREALKYSCNDALAQMSDFLGTEEFLRCIRDLGFGERTGIELPAEARGMIKNQDDVYWSARTKPTMSIGQELTVTALQMVQGATAIANGGIPVKLTVIHKTTDKDGNTEYLHEAEYKDRVLKKATADYILSCMETTATSGTGTRANLGDISIGVKTGTAQMADRVNGGYSTTDFLSNCMAIFPVEDPQIILYIVIEKAKGETYAGRIVAPVIAQAADEIIDYLGMNREGAASLEHSGKFSIGRTLTPELTDTVPDFMGLPKSAIIPLLTNKRGIDLILEGEGWVTSQNPEAGTPLTENMSIELTFE